MSSPETGEEMVANASPPNRPTAYPRMPIVTSIRWHCSASAQFRLKRTRIDIERRVRGTSRYSCKTPRPPHCSLVAKCLPQTYNISKAVCRWTLPSACIWAKLVHIVRTDPWIRVAYSGLSSGPTTTAGELPPKPLLFSCWCWRW